MRMCRVIDVKKREGSSACRGQITKSYLATLGRGNSAKGGDEEIATKRCVEG
jgi:hypothetical protein